MWGVYFLIAFIVLHYLWRTKAEPAIKSKSKYTMIFELPEFHMAIWGSLFWIITIPLYLFWNFLKYITKIIKRK